MGELLRENQIDKVAVAVELVGPTRGRGSARRSRPAPSRCARRPRCWWRPRPRTDTKEIVTSFTAASSSTGWSGAEDPVEQEFAFLLGLSPQRLAARARARARGGAGGGAALRAGPPALGVPGGALAGERSALAAALALAEGALEGAPAGRGVDAARAGRRAGPPRRGRDRRHRSRRRADRGAPARRAGRDAGGHAARRPGQGARGAGRAHQRLSRSNGCPTRCSPRRRWRSRPTCWRASCATRRRASRRARCPRCRAPSPRRIQEDLSLDVAPTPQQIVDARRTMFASLRKALRDRGLAAPQPRDARERFRNKGKVVAL